MAKQHPPIALPLAFVAALRTVRDHNGSWIWQPGDEHGARSTILGFRYVIAHQDSSEPTMDPLDAGLSAAEANRVRMLLQRWLAADPRSDHYLALRDATREWIADRDHGRYVERRGPCPRCSGRGYVTVFGDAPTAPGGAVNMRPAVPSGLRRCDMCYGSKMVEIEA